MNENMVFRKVGNDVVVVPIGKSVDAVRSIYSLNETAGFILDKARGGKSRDEILGLLQEEFEETSPAETEKWLDDTLESLRSHGILL